MLFEKLGRAPVAPDPAPRPVQLPLTIARRDRPGPQTRRARSPLRARRRAEASRPTPIDRCGLDSATSYRSTACGCSARAACSAGDPLLAAADADDVAAPPADGRSARELRRRILRGDRHARIRRGLSAVRQRKPLKVILMVILAEAAIMSMHETIGTPFCEPTGARRSSCGGWSPKARSRFRSTAGSQDRIPRTARRRRFNRRSSSTTPSPPKPATRGRLPEGSRLPLVVVGVLLLRRTDRRDWRRCCRCSR